MTIIVKLHFHEQVSERYPEGLKDQFGMAESREYILVRIVNSYLGHGNYSAQRNRTVVDIQTWVQS